VHTLNLGILAHVDAGKTSLTERLLYAAGVIDEIGRVDDGSTQTDSLALERQRGITIKSAVVSFVVDDVTVNLIDTPGHPDFIAEVERVLSVLDGAVLVVSAVEGVQAQTRVLMRALQRLRIPTVLFVNKMDRQGADRERVLRGIAEKLTPAIVPMDRGERWFEALADHDDALLAAFVEETPVSHGRLRAALAEQTKRALVHPVLFGSARTGAGIDALMGGLAELLPATEGDADGDASGTVFKIERGSGGEKIAYVRMFSGAVRTRDRLRLRDGDEQKVTAIDVFDRGGAVQRGAVAAGQIAKLWGLTDVRIGDVVGRAPSASSQHHFAPPTLETVVVPRHRADRQRLRVALTQLAEQDPLIDVRRDEREIAVSLYGEVQKEVIEATLADDFGLDVAFRETTTIYIERPVGTGAAFEIGDKGDNPFLATAGLRIDPAPIDSGVEFRLEVELGSMPFAFFKAVEDTVRETLQQGLYGWQVTDCTVAMTHSGYWPRNGAHGFDKSVSSTGADFRSLTPLVLMSALQRAGTGVHEPIHRFQLEVPADTLGSVLPVVAALGGVPGAPAVRGATCTIDGGIPAAHVHALRRQLPSLTRGEGLLESTFDGYQPVRGTTPSRPRWDHNPLNREGYMLHVARRVPGGRRSESPMSQNIGGQRPTNSARRSALPRSS
jgi:ribosomal protection tetracycline resistance protein